MKLTPLQAQVDGGVGTFLDSVLDGKSLAAITVGGLAYRAGRISVMGMGGGAVLRTTSVGLGLAAEVSAFEFTHRGLSSPQVQNRNLWKWSGSGGLRHGLLQSFLTFGTLKGAGRLAQGENLIAQHLFQDSAMVLSHQAAGAFGLHERPTGSLAEQFLYAEAANLQVGAGFSLGRGFFPGLHSLERGLDLSLSLPPSFRPLKEEVGIFVPVTTGGNFPRPIFSRPGQPDPKDFILHMSEGEEGPRRRGWLSLFEVKEENPWREFSLRHLIEKSRAGELDAARELARRVYEEPRIFYQKFNLMRLLQGLAEVRDEAIASRFISVLHTLANLSPGVFDRDHVAVLKDLNLLNPEAHWILTDLHTSRPDLRPTIPPPEPVSSDGGQVLHLPWTDPLRRQQEQLAHRAKELFSTMVEKVRVSADFIEFVGFYRPVGGLAPVTARFPHKEPSGSLKMLYTDPVWTEKIERALKASEDGKAASLERLVRILERYIHEPAVEFSPAADSKHTRLRNLLGVIEPRLAPALKHLDASWLAETSKYQFLALHELGRLAEKDNQKALFALIDLSNQGFASAGGILHQVEMKDLIRTALKENDPAAASDAARFAEGGMGQAASDLFSMAKIALSEGKNEVAFAALSSLLELHQASSQDNPFYHLVTSTPELFSPLGEKTCEGSLEEPWLELLKNFSLLGHYGAMDLLVEAAGRLPSARQRLMAIQKAIPKEDLPEVMEFQGGALPVEFEAIQMAMRRQKIRKMAVVQLIILLGRPR